MYRIKATSRIGEKYKDAVRKEGDEVFSRNQEGAESQRETESMAMRGY